MNCIFDSFNKEEATANPFLQSNRNDPGKFTFPSGATLAQAAQVSKGQHTSSGPTFSLFSTQQPQQSLFSPQQPQQSLFSTQQPQQSLFSTQQPQQSLFSPQQPQQSLFSPQQPQQSLFSTPQPQTSFLGGSSLSAGRVESTEQSNPLNLASQQMTVRLTKYTTKITIEKVIALLSSEWYVRDEDITTVSQLNPVCDAKDVTKVAPLAVAAFVDESVTVPLTQLPKIHVKFLQELVQETVKTEDDVWKLVIDLATSYGLYDIVHYINATRPHKTLIVKQQITPEIAFALAVHAFVTNNDRPHNVMSVSKRYSKTAAKLAADMCMASYGLGWILETQTPDYISKHRNTYILSCN